MKARIAGAHRIHHGLEFVQLVFGQRLGREQVHGPRAGVLQQPVEHGQVVAQRLAAGGGRDHHDVLARLDQPDGFGLMHVELPDVPLLQDLPQGRVQRFRDSGANSPGLAASRRTERIGESGSAIHCSKRATGRLQAGSARNGVLGVEFREAKGQIHAGHFRLFFARVHRPAQDGKPGLTVVANELVTLQRRRHQHGTIRRLGGIAFDTDYLTQAAQVDAAAVVGVGGEGDDVLDRLAQFEVQQRGKQHTSSAEVLGLPGTRHWLERFPDDLNRELKVEAF